MDTRASAGRGLPRRVGSLARQGPLPPPSSAMGAPSGSRMGDPPLPEGPGPGGAESPPPVDPGSLPRSRAGARGTGQRSWKLSGIWIQTGTASPSRRAGANVMLRATRRAASSRAG